MTLNGAMAIILRYLTKFCNFRANYVTLIDIIPAGLR